jgi:hypothetical protein
MIKLIISNSWFTLQKFILKKNVGCVGNYEKSNGLVNGVDGIFENFMENISKSLV